MPNIVAHSHITSIVHGERQADIVLGSTLPDFAGMYKARYGDMVAISGLREALDKGIRFHLNTDSAFDAQPEKPLMTEPIAADLRDAGLGYRAARLSAAFAADILLDRALLDYDEALWSFRMLGGNILGGGTSLDGIDQGGQFPRFVQRYFLEDAPRYYEDPRHVAGIIQHRLGVRSQESDRTINQEQIPVLADIIGLHADRAGGLGLTAMRSTIAALRAA